jgi:hypothetical protein
MLRAAVCAVLFTACGSQSVDALDAQPADGPTPRCTTYPIPLLPGNGEAAARAELATLAPTATMAWDYDTNTASTIAGLDLPLSCTAGQNTSLVALELLAAHPALFQLDVGEWLPHDFIDCTAFGALVTTLARSKLANHLVAKDAFNVELQLRQGVPTITGFSASYVPVAATGVGDAMDDCLTFDEIAAKNLARATAFEATTCGTTGTTSYTPHVNDQLQVSTDTVWTWAEHSGDVELSGRRLMQITVDPSNYTPELMASAARCPDSGRIGFKVYFDIHTATIVRVEPGIDCAAC